MRLAVALLPGFAQSAGVLLLATAALVGPLVGVLPLLVQLEEVCPVEPLLTYVASKRFLSRVEAKMPLEVWFEL